MRTDRMTTEGRHPSASADERWHRATKRAFLLDFQMPDSADQMVIGQPANLRNLDIPAIVEQLVKAGVSALYTHALDNQGNCYYNTQLAHKHTDIGDRDLMAEFSKECRARNIRLLFYVQLSRQRRSFEIDVHKARREDGSVVMQTDTTPRLPSREERPVACLNSPHREYILAVAQELAANYDFDGYWFDCFGWWGRVTCCYCETCRAKYQEDTGRNLPSTAHMIRDEWRPYLQWRQRINVLIWREVTEAVRAVNPNLTLTHNGALQPWADLSLYDYDDYVSSEYHYNEGLGNLSLQCRKSRSLKPHTPFEIEIWRFFNRTNDTLRGYQIRPLPMHLVEMSTVLAHGGLIQYYDQINPDGSLEGRSLEGLSSAYDAVRERESWLDTRDPISYSAVMWSHATEIYAQPELAEIHRIGLEGAHHALMEEHLPLAVLNDQQVTCGEFGDNRVVVLPSVTCLSSNQVDQLEQYVRSGGGLVATYRSSLCDEVGRSRSEFALKDLFGAEYLEPLSYLHSFIQPSVEHPITDGLALNWPMTLWKMPQVKVHLLDGASLGSVVNPMRGFHMGHPPMEVISAPSIVAHQYGAGRVVYFSAPIDAVYGAYGHPDYRRLLANAVRWAAAEAPRVEVQAPLSLEAVAFQNEANGRMVVHLLNRAMAGSARAKAAVIQEIVPIQDAVVRISGKTEFSRATLQPSGTKLRLEKPANGSALEVTVPRVDYHEMVVLER